MPSIDALVRAFRDKGLRITPQRRAIFEELAGDTSHPRAAEIYRRVQTKVPGVSRMTVYNTLHELVSLGVLAEVEPESEGGARYDTNADDHHHLYCVRCHSILDIDLDLGRLSIPGLEDSGYQIVRRQVTLYGYCPTCQKA